MVKSKRKWRMRPPAEKTAIAGAVLAGAGAVAARRRKKLQDDWNVPWSWHEMVAQLDDASMRLVVCGPEGRSRGLVGCSFAARPGSYDHKREDGSRIRLHPHWSRPHQAGRRNKSDPFVSLSLSISPLFVSTEGRSSGPQGGGAG